MRILPQLKQTVKISTRSGLGATGRPTYNTEGAAIPADVQLRTERFVDRGESETVVSAKIIVGPDVTLNITDQVELPDDSHKIVGKTAPLYDVRGHFVGTEAWCK